MSNYSFYSALSYLASCVLQIFMGQLLCHVVSIQDQQPRMWNVHTNFDLSSLWVSKTLWALYNRNGQMGGQDVFCSLLGGWLHFAQWELLSIVQVVKTCCLLFCQRRSNSNSNNKSTTMTTSLSLCQQRQQRHRHRCSLSPQLSSHPPTSTYRPLSINVSLVIASCTLSLFVSITRAIDIND